MPKLAKLIISEDDIMPNSLLFRVKLMLGNIEELRDYHKFVMLPRIESAVDNAKLMRYRVYSRDNELSLLENSIFKLKCLQAIVKLSRLALKNKVL